VQRAWDGSWSTYPACPSLRREPGRKRTSVRIHIRYRNRIGMDVVLQALRLWRKRRRKKLDVLLEYARMRHVERAMRPYLEATS